MNEPITLAESLHLIGDIPADIVHPDVITLLVWLSYDPESTNEELESRAKMSRSAVKRAVKWLRETKAVEFQYSYQIGDSLNLSFEPSTSDAAPRGKCVGRKAKLNWVIINHLDEVSGSTSDPLMEGKTSELIGPPRTHSVGPYGTGGKEGTGIQILPQVYPQDSNRVHPQILVLARRAMNDLARAAQQNMGIKYPVDLVPSELGKKQLRRFIQSTMPARSRWTSWERTVNLFSFWVENHPRKNLKFEIGAFIADHEVWMPSLITWENETMDQMRILENASELEAEHEELKAQNSHLKAMIDCAQKYIDAFMPHVRDEDFGDGWINRHLAPNGLYMIKEQISAAKKVEQDRRAGEKVSAAARSETK